MARLNVQGLARRDKGLMACILSDKDMETVSIDLSAGEPTCTAHYSQDPKYNYACFDGVGKEPFFNKEGILMIDDIYLMSMSASPEGRPVLQDAFYNTYDGKTFVERWMEDPDYIAKGVLKEYRPNYKWKCLGLGYGMGPKKLVKQAYDQGEILTLQSARMFYKAYWDLFAGVRLLANRLQYRVEKQGFLINQFGYRLVPEPHKAFNYWIQSSVSGIMHVYRMKLAHAAPWARFITCIHDEFLYDVPVERLEEFKRIKDLACDSLNDDLQWRTKIRTGWATGKNWYDAK